MKVNVQIDTEDGSTFYVTREVYKALRAAKNPKQYSVAFLRAAPHVPPKYWREVWWGLAMKVEA